MRCSERTIRNALTDLVKDRWVQVVQIGAAGTINAYVVNSAVAWGEKREHLRLAVFHAAVVSDAADQPEGALDRGALRRVPVIYPPEQALLAGEGEQGAQIALPGLEPVVEGRRDLVDLARPPAPTCERPPAVVEQMVRSVTDQIERPSQPITLHDPTGNNELIDKMRQLLKEAGIAVT